MPLLGVSNHNLAEIKQANDILKTCADESVLNDKGKIDYHTFKPVLFEFPTYEYFVTGEKVGDCGKMN